MIIPADIKMYSFDSNEPTYITMDQLIDEIKSLRKRGSVFRGQPDSTFSLIPSAFRRDIIEKKYAVYKNKVKPNNYKLWTQSQAYVEIAEAVFHTKEVLNCPEILKINELIFFSLAYNYSLSCFVKKWPHKFDINTIENNKKYPPEYWVKEPAFLDLFAIFLTPLRGILSTDNKILKYSEIEENIVAYDETLPQHYDTPTAALDWSRNPYIGLYYALLDASAIHVSLFAYMQIKQIKNNDRALISLIEGNPNCKNQRIINQEGVFTRFNHPNLYYFHNQQWPTIETFTDQRMKNNFKLIKIDIPITYKSFIEKLLGDRRITDSYLHPNL